MRGGGGEDEGDWTGEAFEVVIRLGCIEALALKVSSFEFERNTGFDSF